MTPQIKQNLKKNELQAIEELKRHIQEKVPGSQIILFGSKARGDFEEFSDIDLLVIVPDTNTGAIEQEILDVQYETELKYDVIFGIVIESRSFWDSSRAKAMPFHWNVDKEGVTV